MKTSLRTLCGATLAITSLAVLSPVAAHADNWFGGGNGYRSQADNQQNNKNTWRNLAIGAGAVAVYGLLNHDSTATMLGAAGAAYSANRYEQDRSNQSNDNSWGNNGWYRNNNSRNSRYYRSNNSGYYDRGNDGDNHNYDNHNYDNDRHRGNGDDRDDQNNGNRGYSRRDRD